MSAEATNFSIKYCAKGHIHSGETDSGPFQQVENLALLGLIRHLYSGVDRARIRDAAGTEVKVLLVPSARPPFQIELAHETN